MSAKTKRKTKVSNLPVGLERVKLNAAAIDIGAREHYVAVPPDRAAAAVRRFGAHTADLHALAAWLKECAVTTVAMESTSNYWIPISRSWSELDLKWSCATRAM